MFALVREHMTAVNIARLLDAVIFNVAVGNVDSHARNYSILLTTIGPSRPIRNRARLVGRNAAFDDDDVEDDGTAICSEACTSPQAR